MRYALGLVFLAFLGLFLGSVVPACSNEGEGQPCSTLGENNGIDECQNGYECVPPRNGTLAGNPTNFNGVCCPGDPTLATQLICEQPGIPLPMDGGTIDSPVTDSPVPSESASEASPDSATDGATDGSTDASTHDGSVDAPAEGTTDAPAEGGG